MSDMAREGAAEAIARLRDIGIRRVVMLTGDQRGAAEAIAREVGIDEVHAGLMPEDKLELIRRMKADGAHVAMVGDGINDAPALAAADTSIAMGAAGSDVAIETADIALLKDDLGKIPEAMAISRATLGNMRQNLVIALVTVAGLLAGVFSGDIHMAGGMLVHQLSVLIVIANGMRLLRVPKAARPAAVGRENPEPPAMATPAHRRWSIGKGPCATARGQLFPRGRLSMGLEVQMRVGNSGGGVTDMNAGADDQPARGVLEFWFPEGYSLQIDAATHRDHWSWRMQGGADSEISPAIPTSRHGQPQAISTTGLPTPKAGSR